MKKQITLRIDEDIIAWFKANCGGHGYQPAMNEALRRYIDGMTAKKNEGPGRRDERDYPEIKTASTINYAPEYYDNDQYFKPMPKTGKKKHGK